MNKHSYILILIFIGFLVSCKSGTAVENTVEQENYKPYVVGYLPMWKMPYSPDWDQLTHVCLAFGFVQADGSLNIDEVVKHKSVVAEAHRHHVQVLISIGGGGSRNFTAAILNPENRHRLVDNLVNIMEELNLDGVDVDYEEWDGGPDGASPEDLKRLEALETLYKELRARVGNDKLIAAAVNADYLREGESGVYNCFNNTMHQYLDFVSLMIYDKTGPWSGTNVGPHSGWDFFEKGIDHWLNNRKLPKEKLVVGVPFYGYHFLSENDATGAQGVPYRMILEKYPDEDAHLQDSIGLLYYDGMGTMKQKAIYIREKGLGGIMFWEITQDTDDTEKSLLKVITDNIHP